MSLNNSENKESLESLEKRDALAHEEIARLKKLLEAKEKELRASLESASLKDEILTVREKLKTYNIEHDALTAAAQVENKEAKIETAREKGKEAAEQHFEDLSIARKAVPTKTQIKKITRQMKDADIARILVDLVNLARFKGVYYAIRIAKKYGNAYLLDRLHDAIVNDLYEELVKNKKLPA